MDVDVSVAVLSMTSVLRSGVSVPAPWLSVG